MAEHRGFVVVGDYKKSSLFQAIPTAVANINQRITWGQPAQITQARLDRQCPRCGARPSEVSYEQYRLTAGIEIKDNMALCGQCNWSYENDSL